MAQAIEGFEGCGGSQPFLFGSPGLPAAAFSGVAMFRFAKFLVPALLLSLAACASPQLRLYEGAAKPAAQVAVITMPEQLEVASINGTEVPGAKGMWSKGDKRLEVLPGRYEALIYYREVWQNAGDSDVLRSKNPALFVIDAQPGHAYRIDYERPGRYEDARRLAENFHGWVDDPTSGRRWPSLDSGVKFKDGLMAQVTGDSTLVPSTPRSDAMGGTTVQAVHPMPEAAPVSAPSVAPVPTVAGPNASPAAPSPVAVAPAAPVAAGADGKWVNLMKGWWAQASSEERREFLRWVGEQR